MDLKNGITKIESDIIRKALYLCAVLLLFELPFLWLALEKQVHLFQSYIDAYHGLVSVIVSATVLVAAFAFVRFGKFRLVTLVALLTVFLLYNPFFPLLLFTQISGVDVLVTANIITAAFFLSVALCAPLANASA